MGELLLTVNVRARRGKMLHQNNNDAVSNWATSILSSYSRVNQSFRKQTESCEFRQNFVKIKSLFDIRQKCDLGQGYASQAILALPEKYS